MAADVTQEENDVNQLNHMMKQTRDNIEAAGCKDAIKVGLLMGSGRLTKSRKAGS